MTGEIASADKVWLSNSDTVKGKIESLKDGKLEIRTDWGGVVSVDLIYVQALETEKMLWVRLKGQSSFKLLKFQNSENKTWLMDDKGNKSSIKDSGEIGTLMTQYPEDHERLISSGSAQLNMQLERNDKQELFFIGTYNLRDIVNSNTLKWKLNITRYSGVIDERDNYVHYDYNRFLTTRWYLVGNSAWNYDSDDDPMESVSLGAGLGYQFWDDADGKLKSNFGLTHLWENYVNESSNKKRWAFTLSTDYEQKLWQNIFLKHNSLLSKRLSGLMEMIYDADTAIKVMLTDKLWVNLLHEFNYNNRPTSKSYRLDNSLTLGIGYDW